MNDSRVASASLSIGNLAQLAGVGVKPTQFYERRLLKAPMRKDFGYRLHPKHILGRIRFIRRVKELGFALKEIK
jgi:DNA-binding transcriptional MerR regulator